MLDPSIKFYKSPSHIPFLWKTVWSFKVPSRINFFVWSLGRILANDNLRKRRLVVDWCCSCKRAGKSSNHLLLHCPIASQLWSMVSTLFGGFFCVFPKDVVELLACWPGKFRKHRNGVIWKMDMLPHCLMWGI